MERNMILITGFDSGAFNAYNDKTRKETRKTKKLYIDLNDIKCFEKDKDSLQIISKDGQRFWIYYNDPDEQEAVFNKLINYCK